jgi:hypothetical protein
MTDRAFKRGTSREQSSFLPARIFPTMLSAMSIAARRGRLSDPEVAPAHGGALGARGCHRTASDADAGCCHADAPPRRAGRNLSYRAGSAEFLPSLCAYPPHIPSKKRIKFFGFFSKKNKLLLV